MSHDYVLKNLIFDPYRSPKDDPQGMTRQSKPESRSICYPAVTTKTPSNMLYVYHYWVYVQILA